ncbi:helix-turn-helix domain-containing protein [Runella sp. SP2]|uniref:helix-turn-helix domain-containing protein n=1 Tax=Runella sp. SP2 TaxID=2268026 RepID=UPI000F08173A|nr:helix-turn-helix domain-containing protein [Runella sp. SP2]AYQ35808.1 DNA-binding protein [Runella sp. SP2]
MSQIILNGIALADLLNEFRAIVKDEVVNLATTPLQPTDGKKYLSAKEAADFLGIKQQTLYQNIKRIPHVKKHGKLLFTREGLISYVEQK